MTRLLSVTALGLLASAALILTPDTSNAQTPFGFSLNFGHGRGINFYQGIPAQYGYGYPAYGSFYSQRYFASPGYDCDYGYRAQPPVIVHPEYYHWTPGRGYHSHGHLHVPTPYGYRTRPY